MRLKLSISYLYCVRCIAFVLGSAVALIQSPVIMAWIATVVLLVVFAPWAAAVSSVVVLGVVAAQRASSK